MVDEKNLCKNCRADRRIVHVSIYDEYQMALAKLKTDPSNATLRQEALAAGRLYSSATRNNGAVTIYDEIALMNDINAAAAGAGAGPSVEERLRKLDDLRTRGLITDQEYQDRRTAILNEI